MLKKRLIGVVTVRRGWAVQSFGYKRWLPLGRPEVLGKMPRSAAVLAGAVAGAVCALAGNSPRAAAASRAVRTVSIFMNPVCTG